MAITKISKAINNVRNAILGNHFSRVVSPNSNAKYLDDLAETLLSYVENVGVVTDEDLNLKNNDDISLVLQNFIDSNSCAKLKFVTKNTYKLSTQVNVTRKLEIDLGNVTLTTDNTHQTIKVYHDGCFIHDGYLDKIKIHFPAEEGYNFKEMTKIDRIKFTNFPTAAAIYGEVSGTKCARHITFSNLTFENNKYAVYGSFCDCIFSFNKLKTNVESARNFQFSGGKNNVVLFNNIDGGTTGITYLSNREETSKLLFENNLIQYNDLRNISEESISLDIFGDNAEKVGVLLTTQIESISSNWITVSGTFVAYSPLKMYAVVVDGTNAGNYSQIVNVNSSTNTFEVADATKFATNDNISVIMPAVNNKILNNNLNGGCIAIWGNGLNNLIENNNLNGGFIRIASLYGLSSSLIAPSFHNIIRYNRVIDSKIDIKAQSFSGATIKTSVGNRVYSNIMINSEIKIDNQEENTEGTNYTLAN